ncbi:MAG: calcium-binding protein, partial [Symploca sp. SIO2G7]|nr:calcium-binding protein [Symploca sp. SIO2G7]
TSSNSTTDNESINTLLPGSGTYYLLVDGYPGNTLNTYDLSWDDRLYLVGTDNNDTLSGTPNSDTIIGLRGDDDIFGDGGNDFLQGDRGDDNIFGEAGDDNIQGDRGDDNLFGGTGNDYLDGDRGDDILVGVDPNSTNPGFGEIDIMTGGFGADIFVLGDENQVYYDDLGIGDYTLITDFDSSLDVIELNGSATNYQLGNVSPGLPSGIGIFLQTPAQDELIAIVQGANSLALNADYFTYVS